MKCTLFGDLVDEALGLFDKDDGHPIILVAQLFKPNFYLNESQPINSISDELHGGSLPITTIEEVLDKTNETSCWILATVVSIEIGGSDWYYALCKSCPRKVKENKGCYLRKHCGKVGINTPLRYHLHVIAADGTGCIGLIIWNQEAKLVVGKSASEVKKISVIQVRRAFLSAVLRLLARVLWLIQMQFISYKKIEAMVGVHKNHLLARCRRSVRDRRILAASFVGFRRLPPCCRRSNHEQEREKMRAMVGGEKARMSGSCRRVASVGMAVATATI
ncbi:hypothetical protein HN51_054685 [Arachis hypogaea]